MSLREDLANALYDAYCSGPRLRAELSGTKFRFSISEIRGDRDASAEMHQEPWLLAADECLRQMMWAAGTSGGESWEADETHGIAPEGWRP